MRSGNPILKDRIFEQDLGQTARMTLPGTVNKAAILFALTLISAVWVWKQAMVQQDFSSIRSLMWMGVLGGLVLALITSFVPKISAYTSPCYALLEGLAIGGVSAMYEIRYPGLVIQAVALTFGTFACMLLIYKTKLIQVTDRLRTGIVAATGAICLVYILDLVLNLFGIPMPFIHQSGTVGILFSLVVVGVAAFNLLLDFDCIEQGVANGSPKYMEWYAAFGLLVTLVWLYLEMLRLLSKLRR